ncbi:hypothetical protein ACFPM0_34310 [Pseudonocardia sulfidoxydans]|uniref:hypothetical protein n=1 Tax=Pseudonocardia sulfidoxydans TaxID=54011 RepID=UPI0036177B1E
MLTRSVSLTKVLPDQPGSSGPDQRIHTLVRTVRRTRIGDGAAWPAAVPTTNGWRWMRRSRGRGPPVPVRPPVRSAGGVARVPASNGPRG